MLEIDPLHEYANGSNELNTIDEAAIIEQWSMNPSSVI